MRPDGVWDGDYFYPRSPRGERRSPPERRWAGYDDFYPRSPRGERPAGAEVTPASAEFLSTLPARGATPGIQREV